MTATARTDKGNGEKNDVGKVPTSQNHESSRLGGSANTIKPAIPAFFLSTLRSSIDNIQHIFEMATNITFHPGHVSYDERAELLSQQGLTIWLTGLSASGKSTIATALEQHLLHLKKSAYRLDGDNIRFGLNKDLGFSPKDREENIRRISEVSLLFASSTTITITSFISPYKADREIARKLHEAHVPKLPFIEVFVDASIETCESRDPKGLYKKAKAGEIKEFTGISAPYEKPEQPEVHIDADKTSIEDAVKIITEYLINKGYLKL